MQQTLQKQLYTSKHFGGNVLYKFKGGAHLCFSYQLCDPLFPPPPNTQLATFTLFRPKTHLGLHL